MKINEIAFVYDTRADMCFIRENSSLRELTIKGPCERQGEITGTWFQIDEKTSHWISFKPDKYRLNTWEAFYKRVSNNQIKYYRRLVELKSISTLLTISFTETDEQFKDPISGKWRSKF